MVARAPVDSLQLTRGLLTGRWIHTATIGAWTIALAVALGGPDRIWGSWTHLAFLAAVVIVAIASTASARSSNASRQFAADDSATQSCVVDGCVTKDQRPAGRSGVTALGGPIERTAGEIVVRIRAWRAARGRADPLPVGRHGILRGW